MSKLNLKTAEERAAEIRAQSAEIEAANAAKAAEKQAEINAGDAGTKAKAEETREQVDFVALAKMEESRAAALKAEVDALQLEMNPSLRPALRTETKPYVKLAELLNRHDNAEDTLAALHEAIRQGRLEADKPKTETEWPSDLSHLTPSQRERTLREMAAGKARSEAAADQQRRVAEIRRRQVADTAEKEIELAKLKEKLAQAEATIAVLRHNPSINEVFPTIDASKVTSGATA